MRALLRDDFAISFCKHPLVTTIRDFVGNHHGSGDLYLFVQTILIITCRVQGGRWASYDDCMTFDEECKLVLHWWRKRNRNDAVPPESNIPVKPGFVPSLSLFKKAVLAAHSDGCNPVQNRIRTRSIACVWPF